MWLISYATIQINQFTMLEMFDLVSNYTDQAIVFFILTLNWFILYAIVHVTFKSHKLKQKALLDTRNRIVSIVHGLLSFWMSSKIFFGADFNLPNNQFSHFICLFSLSYALYDLVACTYYGLADTGLYIHHIFCLIGFGAPLIQGYGAPVALGGLFIAQISNFPMHLRVILRSYGLKYTKSYEYSENLYIAFYSFFRAIICPIFVFWPGIQAPNTPFIPLFVCFGLLTQSIYYITQMKTIIKRKRKNYKQMDQKKISFNWLSEEEKVQQLSFYKKKGGPHIF